MIKILAWPAFTNRAHNPYNTLLYGPMAGMGVEVHEFTPKRLLKAGYAVWHHHWPDNFLNHPLVAQSAAKLSMLFALLDYARARGIKLVWTVHNLKSHDGMHPRLEQWFWRAFTRRLDGYFSLSEAGKSAALEKFPSLRNVPGFVVPHGHYRGMYPDEISREAARAKLGIAADARVLVHIGKIRPYKNVSRLIHTFRELNDPHSVLLIAGQPSSPAIERELKAAADGDPRVKMVFQLVPDADVQLYVRAADLVALPYSEILNSGSALLALSFDQPVLIPGKGSMRELQQQIGEQWIHTYTGELTAGVLEDGLRWATTTTRSPHAPLETLDWPELARKTVEAYRCICVGEIKAQPGMPVPRFGEPTGGNA